MDTKVTKSEFLVQQRQFQAILLVAGFVISGGAVFYHYVEGFSWLDSFYFCMITLTTVGYGDFSPHTNAGKLFTIFYILIGIGIIATLANLLLRNAVTRRRLKRSQND